MVMDNIRRALAKMGEAQNELHAALTERPHASVLDGMGSVEFAAGCEFHCEDRHDGAFPIYLHDCEVRWRDGFWHVRPKTQTNSDETVLREYRHQAAPVIELAKAWRRDAEASRFGNPVQQSEITLEALIEWARRYVQADRTMPVTTNVNWQLMEAESIVGNLAAVDIRPWTEKASLIERAKAWKEANDIIPDRILSTAERIVCDLAAAKPEPEKAPASLVERAKAYMAHHDPYEGPAGYPEPPEDIIQDLAAAQPEPSPSEPCHVGDDEIVTIVEAQSIGEVLSRWREDTERANRAEAEVERLKQEFQVLVIQDDMAALLRACGISDHARPTSCHTILHDEVIPAVERAKHAEAEVERLRNELECSSQNHDACLTLLEEARAEVERLRKQVDECRRFLSALTEEQ